MMHKVWSYIEEVPYCFSTSSVKFQGHTGQKNHQFRPELSISRLWLKFEFNDGFEMMHTASWSIEEVPYYFSRSSIKFQGHLGWKIDDLNPIWVRLLGRSQLSNPSDLPCYILKGNCRIFYTKNVVTMYWIRHPIHNFDMQIFDCKYYIRYNFSRAIYVWYFIVYISYHNISEYHMNVPQKSLWCDWWEIIICFDVEQATSYYPKQMMTQFSDPASSHTRTHI